ncbi:MAG: flagellin N-terminal helical domain-containing protein [Phycisphaerales bacterium]
MSSIPSNLARVSSTLVNSILLNNLNRSSTELVKLQEQLSTGKRVNRPSDDASVVSGISLMNRTLSLYDQQLSNLSQAQIALGNTDQALSDINTLIQSASTIASSQIGIGSTAETRANQAQVIVSQINELLNIANRQVNGIHLFGGDQSTVAPFGEFDGGIRYTGSTADLQADLGYLSSLGINVNGNDALGALSGRINSSVDLDPQTTAATRLNDVSGARGRGVTLGSVTLNVDGAAVTVDLRGSDNLGDITTRINDAINNIDPTAGSLGISGGGFTLTANATHQISVADIGTGIVAADLGIGITADASLSGVPVIAAGADLDPKLTALTALASLGASVDFTGGLKVTQGGTTSVIDFSAATTVQDLINAAANSGLGVRMSISADGKSLSLVNEVSGLDMSVGENAGGSTAADLGLRTLDTTTQLSDLNFGKGVETVTGADFRIHTHSGSDIDVDLANATTVQDVLAAINAAGGGSVTASLASDGNGIVLTDATAGADAFATSEQNGSHTAEQLGLLTNAGAGNTITGSDVGQVRVESVLTHLMMLRDGLTSDNEQLITDAGSKLSVDGNSVTSARADVGVRERLASDLTSRLSDQKLSAQSLLSNMQDADYNEVVSKFVLAQQQMQGALLAGQKMLSLSLLDFLQ